GVGCALHTARRMLIDIPSRFSLLPRICCGRCFSPVGNVPRWIVWHCARDRFSLFACGGGGVDIAFFNYVAFAPVLDVIRGETAAQPPGFDNGGPGTNAFGA